MDTEPLTHDQLVARVQAFYDYLRKDYQEWQLEVTCCLKWPDEQEKAFVKKQYDLAAERLDTYTHTFEKVLYTWIH